MLVDVIPMRIQGAPLSKEALKAVLPVRGHLTISAGGVAELQAPDAAYTSSALPDLHRVRLHSMRGNEFMLHGIEPNGKRMGQEAIDTGTPQAWWCKLARGTPPTG